MVGIKHWIGLLFFSFLLFGCLSGDEVGSGNKRIGELPNDFNQTKPSTGGNIWEQLVEAKATYEYEKEMILDSINRVEFVISKNLEKTELFDYAPSFKGSTKIDEREVKVGDVISAQLIDPSNGENFKITPLSVEIQTVFLRDTFGYLWQWDITPLKQGTLPLRLKAMTRINGQDINIKVFDTDIVVFSREEEPRNVLIYIAGGLAILIVGILWFFRKKKKAKKQKAEQIPEQLVDELNQLIGKGDTLKAINRLEEYFDKIGSKKLKDLVLLKSSWNENKRKGNLNLIDNEEEGIENSKIKFALLDLINKK